MEKQNIESNSTTTDPRWFTNFLPTDTGARVLFLIRDGSLPCLVNIAQKCSWPVSSTTCPACWSHPETTDHLIFDCPAYAFLRDAYYDRVNFILDHSQTIPLLAARPNIDIRTVVLSSWRAALPRCTKQVSYSLSLLLLIFLRKLWSHRCCFVRFDMSFYKKNYLSHVERS